MSESSSEKSKGKRKVLTGVVTSAKPDKTIVVKVMRLVQHPKYKKYVRRWSRFMAHDEHNECSEGDSVTIIESRPISKLKRWRLKEVIERASLVKGA